MIATCHRLTPTSPLAVHPIHALAKARASWPARAHDLTLTEQLPTLCHYSLITFAVRLHPPRQRLLPPIPASDEVVCTSSRKHRPRRDFARAFPFTATALYPNNDTCSCALHYPPLGLSTSILITTRAHQLIAGLPSTAAPPHPRLPLITSRALLVRG